MDGQRVDEVDTEAQASVMRDVVRRKDKPSSTSCHGFVDRLLQCG